MDFSKLGEDDLTYYGAYTKQVHRDVYPAIDPKKADNSQNGKVIIITGAGSGIGATGLVPAFAKAGARAIVLVGRRAEKLREVAEATRKNYPDVEILELASSIADQASVESLFKSIESKYGSADVLVNNAGIQTEMVMLSDSSPANWWKDLEVNVFGTYLTTWAFLKLLGKEKHGTVINMSSGAATFPTPTISNYGISKLGMTRINEYVAMENPNVTALSLDPGIVMTDMVPEMMQKFARDTPELVGGTAVWLSTEKARFLSGRFVRTSWDVDELVAQKDKISEGNELKFELRQELKQFGK